MNPIISFVQNKLVTPIIVALCFMIALLGVILFIAFKVNKRKKKGWLNLANIISMFYGIFTLLLGLVVIVIPIIDANQSANDVELSNAIIIFILGSLKIFMDTFKNSIELNEL